jgi:hypothetical protein
MLCIVTNGFPKQANPLHNSPRADDQARPNLLREALTGDQIRRVFRQGQQQVKRQWGQGNDSPFPAHLVHTDVEHEIANRCSVLPSNAVPSLTVPQQARENRAALAQRIPGTFRKTSENLHTWLQLTVLK